MELVETVDEMVETVLMTKNYSPVLDGTDGKLVSPSKIEVEWIPSLVMKSTKLPLRWILENYHSFYSDPKILQRLLTPWPRKQRDSYFYDLFRGAGQKDVIILAQIRPIIDYVKVALNGEKDPTKKSAYKENLEYFQGLLDNGKEFIIIDGQHRFHEIDKFFHMKELKKEEKPFSTPDKKPFTDFRIKGDPDSIPYDLNNGFFQEWIPQIRDFIFDNVKLLTSVVGSGDIKELKCLFVGANSGGPLTFFEQLIIESWSPIQRHIVDFTDPSRQSEHVLNLSKKFSKFTGIFDPLNKGLDLCFSEMLLYILSNYGRKTEIPMYGSNGKKGLKIIFSDDFTVVNKSKLKLHTDNILIIANGLAKFNKTNILGRASLCNAFVLLCMMRDKDHFRRNGYDIPIINVKDPVRFMKWFLKTEDSRIWKNRYIVDDKGKKKLKDPKKGNKEKNYLTNDHSYSAYLRTVWGNAHLEFREEALWNDLVRDYEQLKTEGILLQVGKHVSSPAHRRAELAALDGWIGSEGEELDPFDIMGTKSIYDVSHKIHKDDGGDASIENTKLEKSSPNRRKRNW